ncbi:hypothetical protein K0B96_11240 [Horticoccus luteus]|uniref:Uncharacterized protein n=1 Tax=Horticoccus luteus TaxID=2862869 RepID=A0A8F9XG66_9BACT|nr:hypothetical protein [Horticoccus luteus]QYM77890.1 hypothetical protein K0B96_11240 [Horticoccus luteus]
MSAPLQLIRFSSANVATPAAVAATSRALLDVHVGSGSAPAGQVVFFESPAGQPSWRYVLPDGQPSGLASEISRVDLETRIMEHYFTNLLPHPRSA